MSEETKTQEQNVDTEVEEKEEKTDVQKKEEEKKYTDTDVNNISSKNSKKAVQKLMKELGIPDNADMAAVREIIAKSGIAKKSDDNIQQNTELVKQLEEAQHSTENAVLENILLLNHVKPEKVEKAVKLIDRKDCLDEDGKFSRDKAKNAVIELLKDWQELVKSKDEESIGFKIGGDGDPASERKQGKKPPVQKSWNKFNYS